MPSDDPKAEHDHNYLSTKGPGEPARGPLTPLQRVFAATEPEPLDLECTGSKDCAAPVHLHGCFAECHRRVIAMGYVPPPELPADEQWPCRSDHMTDPPPRLVAALYRIMRDHVAPGDLEQVMLDIGRHDGMPSFTNLHLAAYAQSLTAFLLAGWTPPPRRPSVAHTGRIVVGDQCDDPNCPVCGVP